MKKFERAMQYYDICDVVIYGGRQKAYFAHFVWQLHYIA